MEDNRVEKKFCPAFPTDHEVTWKEVNSGMNMREWYAGQAMNGILNMIPLSNEWPDPDRVADYAFKIADAMLRRHTSICAEEDRETST